MEADLPYRNAPGAGVRQRLDIYTPATPATLEKSGGCPTLVWLHGGGLTGGDKSEGKLLAQYLALRGIATVLVNYSFLSEGEGLSTSLPPLEDAAAAVAWVASHAGASLYGLDPARIFIGGYSAGAYLAAMLAMDEGLLVAAGLAPSSIQGCVILSAQMTTHFQVRKGRGHSPHGIVSDEASPLSFCRAETMPLLVMVGDEDIPTRLEENQLFAAVMKAAGNTNLAFHVMPDRTHASVFHKATEPGDRVGVLIAEFVLGGKRGAG